MTTLSWSRSSPTSPAALCLTLPSGVCRERRVPDHAGLPGRRRGGAERPGGGGRAVLLHSKTAEGAPADFFGSHGSIRPFAGSPWDGAHFCAADWHVILIADFEGGDASFKHADAERIMNALEVSFTLDGTALPATRTAIKRFLNPEQFGLEAAYYFQQGQIMSPADLSIGSHRLEVTMLDASGQQSFQDGITFVIDPPGTGACV